jgi:hypothetical protein
LHQLISSLLQLTANTKMTEPAPSDITDIPETINTQRQEPAIVLRPETPRRSAAGSMLIGGILSGKLLAVPVDAESGVVESIVADRGFIRYNLLLPSEYTYIQYCAEFCATHNLRNILRT